MIYAERWDALHRAPDGPLTEQQARSRWVEGPTFAVVLGDPEAPDAVLEVDPGATRVLVTFPGPGGATSTTYLFRRRGDRLFLERVEGFWYEGDQLVDDLGADLAVATPWSPAGVVRHESMWLRPDGVAHRVVDAADQPALVAEDRDGMDVDVFWEDVPLFGRWDGVARYER